MGPHLPMAQVLDSMWDAFINTNSSHAHIESCWVIMASASLFNDILMVIALAVICYGTCHFGQEPVLIE